jgi:hypothetical protein
VPDDDVIPRRVPRHWKKAARMAGGTGSAEEVARRLTLALAATLRESGGCPGLGAIGAGLAKSVRGESEWRIEEARLREELGDHSHIATALRIARTLAESRSGGLAGLSDTDVKQMLATEVLTRLTARNFFGRIRPGLAAVRFKSFEDAQSFERDCVAAMPMNSLAQRLLAHESGEGLVAPPSGQPVEGTAALLHKPIAG